MESIVGSAALDAIAQQDAAEKQAIDTKATSALNTANEVAGQFITVKAAAEAATATATNAYTAAQTANAAASNAQTQILANRQAIVSEANTRGQADTALQAQITNIVNGTTVVGKATNDANGNNISTTYATKAELAPVATSGDYDDLTNKPTAGTNIEISVTNVISAPNVPAKTEAVGSFTLSLDPQTYELSIQAKDVNGTNIGTAQTVDLPIETMVVSGSYDDATQSITLTLQNGQTITFSVAGLVAGLQTQLTFDSTPVQDSANPVTSGGVYSALANKQNTLTFDAAPTNNSSNPVTSGGVYDALSNKQSTLTTAQLNAVNSGITDTLVTKLNGIAAGAEVNVQANWSQTDNTKDDYINNKPTLGTAATKAYTTSVSSGSADLVTSGAVYTALTGKQNALTASQLTAINSVGNLANLKTTVKINLVSAINEIVSKVQSRPIITVKTYVSDDSKSTLTPSDVVNAGFSLPVGSYLVTVYRDTSSSLTYFIGWVWCSDTFDDSTFYKVAGEGTSLITVGNNLIYEGGDSGTNIETTWIFQPIGDSHADN